MRRLVATLLLLLLLNKPAIAETDSQRVLIERKGDEFFATFTLDQDAPAWAFSYSPQMQDAAAAPWRLRDWRILTPDVVIDRRNTTDLLTTRSGAAVPRLVHIALNPSPARVSASYNPALNFGGGAVALYSGQFDVTPQHVYDERGGIDAKPALVTWRDLNGPILFHGELKTTATAANAETYVLFGMRPVDRGEGLTIIRASDLPSWISERIEAEASARVVYYAERLGGSPVTPPTIMAAWSGPTPRMTSMGGSVLPGLIAITFEGEDLLSPSEDAAFNIQWFLAHEAAHFWLGHTVRYEDERDLWITEGGADLMAIRAVAAADPSFPTQIALDGVINECATLASSGPVSTASERNAHRAYYVCGAVFALAAEAAQSRKAGGDWLDVVRELIEANRTDGVLTRAEWLEHFEHLSNRRSRNLVEQLLDNGGPESMSWIRALFDETGVSYREDLGRLILDGVTPPPAPPS